MKISDKELKAALVGFQSRGTFEDCMRKALEAAYTVRAARKAAKRAKAKPSVLDEDQQEALGKPKQPEHRFKVGDRVVHAVGGLGTITTIDESECHYLVDFGTGQEWWSSAASLLPAPAKPEWNGKFEVGKAYRTRAGQKATVDDSAGMVSYPLRGRIDGARTTWAGDGRYLRVLEEHPLDLILPWVD